MYSFLGICTCVSVYYLVHLQIICMCLKKHPQEYTAHSTHHSISNILFSRRNQTFHQTVSFCLSFVLSHSACDRSLEGSSISISGQEVVFHRVTLRRTLTHCTSTHRRSTRTLCSLAHPTHTVLGALRFSTLFDRFWVSEIALDMSRNFDTRLGWRRISIRLHADAVLKP